MIDIIDDKSILITGGTGSLGRALCKHLLEYHKPRKVIVYSRDTIKQWDMELEFDDSRLRFIEGDVRDVEQLRWAFAGVDLVVHAAADKIVDKCEKNPIEAVKTNIQGTKNVIEATKGLPIEKAIFISSDKALAPANLYGATKMVGEKLFIDANAMRPDTSKKELAPIFSCTRWGNIENSRGSVIQYFRKLAKEGKRELDLHDKRCTRFLLNFDEAISLLLKALAGPPGLIWIKKSPSVYIRSIIDALDCKHRETHLQPGEKLHEMMLTWEECARAYENEDNIVILPARVFDTEIKYDISGRLPRKRSYTSDVNTFLDVNQIKERIAQYE